MSHPHRSLRSPLLGAFGLLLLVAGPLAGQKKTAAQLRGEAFLAKLPETLARQFQTVVMPTLVQAESNDRVFDQAEQNYTAWIRQLELNGIQVDPSSLELALVARGKAYRTAILGRGRYCFERKDPSEIVIMQALWRTAESQDLETGLTAETLEQLTSKCLRFELIFTSDIRLVMGHGTQRSVVKATVPVTVDPSPDSGAMAYLIGSGPIEYVSFELKMTHLPNKCPIHTSTQSAQATVRKLKFDLKRASAKAPGRFSGIELWLVPGMPTENIRVCDDDDIQSRWFTFFRMLHLAELTSPDRDYFIFKGWKVGGAGGLIAIKDVPEPSAALAATARDVGKMISGRLRMEIRHTPVWP